MAKKRKRGRKSKASKTKPQVQKQETPVVFEKRGNIFSSIYNLSIGRIRVIALLLVLIGLILICVGGISLFNAVKLQVDKNKDVEENTIGDINGEGLQTEKDENEVAGTDDNKDEEKPEVKTQDVTDSAAEARAASAKSSDKTGKWTATNYVSGDIKSGLYTVEKGDTLWEISEAVYGSGFSWHKILDANTSAIGFLPNGSHALIVPGQVLTLP